MDNLKPFRVWLLAFAEVVVSQRANRSLDVRIYRSLSIFVLGLGGKGCNFGLYLRSILCFMHSKSYSSVSKDFTSLETWEDLMVISLTEKMRQEKTSCDVISRVKRVKKNCNESWTVSFWFKDWNFYAVCEKTRPLGSSLLQLCRKNIYQVYCLFHDVKFNTIVVGGPVKYFRKLTCR